MLRRWKTTFNIEVTPFHIEKGFLNFQVGSNIMINNTVYKVESTAAHIGRKVLVIYLKDLKTTT